MKTDEDLGLDVRLVLNLREAINNWLAARDEYKMQPSEDNEYNYNATYFALGEAVNERFPEAADTPGAFEWFRRGLITPEEE